jgi:multisubunit Na+/H+ antiporter MnhE subunit
MLRVIFVIFGFGAFLAAALAPSSALGWAAWAVALAVGVAAARAFGGLGEEAVAARNPLASARALMASLPAVGSGSLRVAQAAVSADVAMTPGLLQVRLPTDSATDAAVFGARLSRIPGVTPVELGEGVALIHTLDEDKIDPQALRRLAEGPDAARGAL